MSEHRRGGRVLATIVTLLWAATVVAAYYVAHKPFAVSNLLAVGQALAGVGGAMAMMALGAGIGLVLLQRFDLGPVERLIGAAAVGLGVVSLAGLVLGMVGLLRPWLLWLLTAAGLAATAQLLWQALLAAWADRAWWPEGRFEKLLGGYCGAMLAVALIWALTPPTAWDGLVYHLTGPKLYLATGRVSHPLDLPYLGFPQMVEMLFAWGIGLGGERAAAPIHWFYGLLMVLVLVTAGRRWMGGAAGWLAAAVLLSAPSIVLLAGWPYVDLALMVYTTLAFLSLARFREGDPGARPWLLLSGVFAGLALSTKYTALALLPALALTLLLAHRKSAIRNPQSAIPNPQSAPPCTHGRNPQSAISILHLLLLTAVALAVWSPWLLKNLLLTGNPVYPFFLDGRYWDAWRTWWYDRPGTGLLYTAPWKLLTAPWDATVWGVEEGEGYSATIGPLYLAFLPLLFLAWRRLPVAQRRWLGSAITCGAVLYGFWLWGLARTALLRQTRLLFPAFGLLALLVGAAVEGLRGLPRLPLNLGWLARVLIVLVLLLNLAEAGLAWVREGPVRVLLGFESREEYLDRRLGWYHVVVESINRTLPPDATVLFLWEPRSYSCAVDCQPDALLDRWLHTTHLYGHDADAIARAWQADGITHVLLYRTGYRAIVEAGFDPVTPQDVVTLQDLEARYLSPVGEWGDAYTLFEVVP